MDSKEKTTVSAKNAETYEKTLKEVKEVVNALLPALDEAESAGNEALTEETVRALQKITERFGTGEYAFNLALEYFVEKTFRSIAEILETILERALLSCKKKIVPKKSDFAAYYALSLIYKKTDDLEGLRGLAEEIFEDAFFDYPLYNEVFSRYYKRSRSPYDYRKALNHDGNAIFRLMEEKICNPGVYCSFASTVCMVLEYDADMLSDDELPRAMKYIKEAIARNPRYPKYYYIKAKLDFLSGLSLKGKEFDALCKRVLSDLQRAESYLVEKKVYRGAERKEYQEFCRKVWDIQDKRKHPRFTVPAERLDEIKKAVLEAPVQNQCHLLPPVPEHREEDRYFFVCYSTLDFHSVYCDLLELYRHKVPFLYDQNIASGNRWQEYVKERITDKRCVGAVFYLSKNMLNSPSFCEEIELVTGMGKPYFCVNLEGKMPPSEILIDIILKNCKPGKRPHPISGKQMRIILDAFEDNVVYTSKFGACDDTRHLDKYIFDITTRFEELTVGE
ncbi:MAG: toll/interleukin-1 receptor domain-containing protein [Clostridia bacterium]|nr:toll/interleukin-1 receptor domain-containing protein [Clostridia bacterium]